MQVELAGRAGQPAGQVQVADPQRLGGDEGLAQPDAAGPAGEVVRDDAQGQPGGVGGELAGGQVVEADAVLEVTDHVLDLRVAAVVGLQRKGVPVAVGDKAVVVVVAEQRQLGSRGGPHAAHDQPHHPPLAAERPVAGLRDVGAVVQPVGDRRPRALGDLADDLVDGLAELDRDRAGHPLLVAGVDDLVGVEAGVGPQRDRTGGTGAAGPVDRLGDEAGRAPAGVGHPFAQAGAEHIAAAGDGGQQRVVATLAVAVDPGRALLLEPVGLAVGGVDVDGQRPRSRRNACSATWSSCRAEPQVNERKNVPSVDGAATRWPSTCPVAPARSRSASPIHSPPARAEWITVMALSPMWAAPGVSPRSRWVSNSSRSRSPSARLAARIRPASATAWSSSKATVIWSGLWDDRTEQVSSWLGRTVV